MTQLILLTLSFLGGIWFSETFRPPLALSIPVKVTQQDEQIFTPAQAKLFRRSQFLINDALITINEFRSQLRTCHEAFSACSDAKEELLSKK